MGIFGNRKNIDDEVAAYRTTEGAALIDVRSADEFAGGHIPGAINLPLDQIQSIDLPADTPLFVYCHSGMRAGSAVKWLEAHGYSARNIGGMMNYNGPVE